VKGKAHILLPFTLHSSIRPPWLGRDESLCLPLKEIPELPTDGEGLLTFRQGDRPLHAILRRNDHPEITIDYRTAIRNVQNELYSMDRKPLASVLPTSYHWIPHILRRQLTDIFLFRLKKRTPFPRFPVERSLEAFRYALSRCGAVLGDGPEGNNFWPYGKQYCICLTHDIDTEIGIEEAEGIVKLEAARGLKSCWYVVGRLIARHPDALETLVRMDQEVGLHGHMHSFRLPHRSENTIRRILSGYKEIIREYGILGFRSPHYNRSPRLFQLLPEFFRYDSSIPDSDPFSLGRDSGGCCRIFPFMRGRIRELPITLPFDIPLHMGVSPSDLLRFWMEKILWIREAGGLILVNTHPEPAYLVDGEVRRAYEELLDMLQDGSDAWVALPREIVEHIRDRT